MTYYAKIPGSDKVIWQTEFVDIATRMGRATAQWYAGGDVWMHDTGRVLLEIYDDDVLYDKWGVVEKLDKVVTRGL